jgi:hypothetical protein
LGIEAIATQRSPIFIGINGTITSSQTESTYPYMSFGNAGNDVYGKNLTVGSYTITAHPTAGAGNSGRLTRNFRVVSC